MIEPHGAGPGRGYPTARWLPLVEDIHGHRVADPYRWLEDVESPATRAFQDQQDRLSREVLDGYPGREMLAAVMRRLADAGSVSVPVWRRDRAFFTQRSGGAEHGVLKVLEPGGGERVLLDPTVSDPSGRTTLDSWEPSLEGDRVAYQLSVAGTERAVLAVLDVASGDRCERPIDRCRYSPVAWLPGGSDFCYVRSLGEDAALGRRVFLHHIGDDADTDRTLTGPGMYGDPSYVYRLRASDDGRWLLVSGAPGASKRDSLWIADLHGDGTLRPVATQADGLRAGGWWADGRLYVLTTLDAPRRRLCLVDPQDPSPDRWQEVIAEDPDAVLVGARILPVSRRIVVARTRHALAELSVHSADGRHEKDLPLPGAGALTGLAVAPRSAGTDDVWVGWTDFCTPPQVYRVDPDHAGLAVELTAPGAVTLPRIRATQLSVRADDGQLVRMFVLSPAGRPDRPRPALLTAYGGFAISAEPKYTVSALTWVAAGGVWALAMVRGGGEEGEEWHRAGMREHKQQSFDDFRACARALTEQGWTTPGQLGISGESDGGLVIGAAITQDPELYGAAVCSAPILDMLRYERFLIGGLWRHEYGSAAHPVECEWLLGYSPYHRVRSDVVYPATLFSVFESDTRVSPIHADKTTAAMQHANGRSSDAPPVLLRRWSDLGHGDSSVSRAIDVLVDHISFLAEHTGLNLTSLVDVLGPVPDRGGSPLRST